jgi:transposase
VGFGQVRTAKQLPVLTMVSGYSRWASALLVPSRCAEDLFAGWWAEIEALGAVPRTLVWDGEGAIGRRRAGRIELTAECQAFRGTLAASVYVCQPRDPEAKGLVERFHDYLERSWLPGREFTGPADFNARLGGWLATVNTRWRRHLECSPADRIAADRAAMIALPPVAPAAGWRRAGRLPRDHYVRLDGNDYSVDPAVIGRRIEITAGLARVRVWCEGRLAADHERAWARHQAITDPAHLAAAQALRAARRLLAPVTGPAGAEVEHRDLAVYDALCGSGEGAA